MEWNCQFQEMLLFMCYFHISLGLKLQFRIMISVSPFFLFFDKIIKYWIYWIDKNICTIGFDIDEYITILCTDHTSCNETLIWFILLLLILYKRTIRKIDFTRGSQTDDFFNTLKCLLCLQYFFYIQLTETWKFIIGRLRGV